MASRYAEEYTEYELKMLERQMKEEKTGKKIRGKKPKAPAPNPQPNEQMKNQE